MFRGSRSLLALLALLALASTVAAGTPDRPEILDDANDVAEDPDQPLTDYGAIEIVKVWLDEETPEHFLVIADMGAAIEPSETPTQQFSYTLSITYDGTTLQMPATVTDEGSGPVASGADIDQPVVCGCIGPCHDSAAGLALRVATTCRTAPADGRAESREGRPPPGPPPAQLRHVAAGANGCSR